MEINKENFVEALKNKEEEALEYLMNEYGNLFKTIVRRNLNRLPEQQEECLDDVFFQIWQHIESFDPQKSTFRNWAVAICKFRTIDYMRRYQREQQRRSSLAIEEIDLLIEDEDLAKVLEEDMDKRLEELLCPLSEKDKALFIRIYRLRESPKEVAEKFRIRESYLYNRLSRGRKRIREFLVKMGDSPK